MHTDFDVTDRLIPNELKLGQKFQERFRVAGPVVEKPKYVGYPMMVFLNEIAFSCLSFPESKIQYRFTIVGLIV